MSAFFIANLQFKNITGSVGDSPKIFRFKDPPMERGQPVMLHDVISSALPRD